MKALSKAIDSDLLSKLRSSSAMQSLIMERRAGSILRNLKWKVLQSCYYKDVQENKIREIDVVGKQFWKKKTKGDDLTVSLHAVIECKSAKAFHLLLLPESNPEGNIHLPHEWTGWEWHHQRLAEALESSGLTKHQIVSVMNNLSHIAFPEGQMLVADLRVDPPVPPIRASAFRETNIAAEKELEASVIWRAGLTLSSAISSFKEQHLSTAIEWIEFFAKMQTGESDKIAIGNVLNEYAHRADNLVLFHPIVVIDSALWAIKRDKPQQIAWCRLEQHDVSNREDWWFDVVNLDSFPKYMTELTQHYKAQMLAAKAKSAKA